MPMEEAFSILLEDEALEDVLEIFDITPEQALEVLFEAGLIDEEEVLERVRYA